MEEFSAMAHHFNTGGVFGISKFDTSKLACNCIVNKLLAIMTKTLLLYEPRREKTGFLHMQKQRRRSASR